MLGSELLMANRGIAFSKVPEPGLLGGVIPVAFNRNAMLTGYISPNQTFIARPNQDVAYGASFMTLDKEPIVFQVPDFGDRFWVYAHYDARSDELSEIGKQYGTEPGFYMMGRPKLEWRNASRRHGAADRIFLFWIRHSWRPASWPGGAVTASAALSAAQSAHPPFHFRSASR